MRQITPCSTDIAIDVPQIHAVEGQSADVLQTDVCSEEDKQKIETAPKQRQKHMILPPTLLAQLRERLVDGMTCAGTT